MRSAPAVTGLGADEPAVDDLVSDKQAVGCKVLLICSEGLKTKHGKNKICFANAEKGDRRRGAPESRT